MCFLTHCWRARTGLRRPSRSERLSAAAPAGRPARPPPSTPAAPSNNPEKEKQAAHGGADEAWLPALLAGDDVAFVYGSLCQRTVSGRHYWCIVRTHLGLNYAFSRRPPIPAAANPCGHSTALTLAQSLSQNPALKPAPEPAAPACWRSQTFKKATARRGTPCRKLSAGRSATPPARCRPLARQVLDLFPHQAHLRQQLPAQATAPYLPEPLARLALPGDGNVCRVGSCHTSAARQLRPPSHDDWSRCASWLVRGFCMVTIACVVRLAGHKQANR